MNEHILRHIRHYNGTIIYTYVYYGPRYIK